MPSVLRSHPGRWAALLLVIVVAAVVVVLEASGEEAPPAQPAVNHAYRGEPKAKRVTIWAVGDGAAGTPAASALAARITKDDPDKVLYLGDVYETGSPDEFRANFAKPYRQLLTRMLPTPGNHEWPAHLEGYDPFWKSVTGAKTPPWYAVRLGAWQVLSLNSEAPHADGDPQVQWLKKRLAEPATCRLAFWHRPRYSGGTHGDQPDIAPLWDALQGHAALILNGHDHDTQVFKPVDGTVEIVAGAGGRGFYPVDRGHPGLAFANDNTYAALRIVLGPESAAVRVIATDGRVLDHTRIRCS